ncbi:MAG: hypothetical protein ACK4NW_02995 [Roseinatronobacter sp.]
MRRSILISAIVFAAGAAQADTTRYDGTYAIDPLARDCVVGQGDVPGAAFRIENGRFFGVESVCRLANPTNIRDMEAAMLFDLQCSGEGTEWSDRILLMKLDDGSLLRVVNGLAFTNPLCRE